MKAGKYKKLIFLVLTLVIIRSISVFAQDKIAIEKAIKSSDIAQADRLVQQAVNKMYRANKADSLNGYTFYIGQIAALKVGEDLAVKAVEQYIQKIKTLSPKPDILRQTYLNAAEYYGAIGKNRIAYQANKSARQYTLSMPGNTMNELALIENNLGALAARMNEVATAANHYRMAMQNLRKANKINNDLLYTSYNNMGNLMYFASKLDSAQYYFDEAIRVLKKTAPTPYNHFYRPAIIHNNVSAIYSLQGKQSEAIYTMKLCINEISRFVNSKEPHPKKTSAVTFQFEATDNLAGMYKEVGDYSQARALLLYSYQQKQKLLGPSNPAIFISQILLGQLYYAVNDYDNALAYLTIGLSKISKSDGDYLFWQADACATLALVNDKLADTRQAALYFERADKLYEQSLQGSYDNIYLEFLQSAALFYAENKLPEKAMSKASKAYNYTLKVEGKQSLLTFYQMLNMAEVYSALSNHKQALNYSNKALTAVNRLSRSSTNLLDSIRKDLKKPKAILIKQQAIYQLLTKKTFKNLVLIMDELNNALAILEKRKVLITDPKDINTLIADNALLLNFAKKVTLELYRTTGDQKYADQLVKIHESALYTRIRSRLDQAGNMQFANLPTAVQRTETKLKRSISEAFNGIGTHDQKMQVYLRSVEKWNQFLQNMQADYPAYYKMRYASIFKPLNQIQARIPKNVTVVRYFFVGNELMVLVADHQKRRIFNLKETNIGSDLKIIADKSVGIEQSLASYHALYKKLWLPISKIIAHQHVIVIPDGILYNLNFELLTPQKLSSFEELRTKSLLAKYSISYHYSIFLLGKSPSGSKFKDNFVGFAPGFSDRVKSTYLKSRGDSLEVDQLYMNLLPQPFAALNAVKANELMGGSLFTGERSTLTKFRENAGKHKIIHIGTHAEANDQHPEFSRILFAKNQEGKEASNSLYLSDIYNCDLTSNLTVLAACETGKPGYQDGEGMISLAHAFNYAGSESMITGLWKIDEQVSAKLTELFYGNLLKGLPKDIALQQAKLSYLSTASGRALDPKYWAGLVLMGDTQAIIIDSPWFSSWLTWVIIVLIFAATLSCLYLYRKRGLQRYSS